MRRRTNAYAAGTKVSAERSKIEIERTLMRYGASRFVSGFDGNEAKIMFEAHGRTIRLEVRMPIVTAGTVDADQTPRGWGRWTESRKIAWVQTKNAQMVRERWRALALAIKAKLAAVESGVASFEDEFLPYTVLPNRETVATWLQSQICRSKMPLLLAGGK